MGWPDTIVGAFLARPARSRFQNETGRNEGAKVIQNAHSGGLPHLKPAHSFAPRYSHLLEVLDGAAALRMAIRQAEEALSEPSLDSDDRALLESVLEASQERFARVSAALHRPGHDGVEMLLPEAAGDAALSDRELMEVARAAEAGSEEAERDAVRAIDRIGRSLRVSTRSCIEELLGHSSPLLRATALKVLTLHWRLRDYTDRVLWALSSESEPDCRRAAALCLGSLYEGTRNSEIGRELVAVMTSDSEEEDVRWASYYALLDVDGRGLDGRPLPVREFRWPQDADADLIEQYRAGS